MNFLAHQYLAGDDQHLRVGNFIADFVKGKKYQNYEKGIRIGILMHREIDWYTDHHSIIKNLNNELRVHFGKYAGVATDVYFDHFLAVHWKQYSNTDLRAFTLDTYQLMESYKDILPDRTRHMLGYMKRDNWLFNYQYPEGVGRALRGIASRSHFESGLEKGQEVLEENYDLLERAFKNFIVEIGKERERLLQSATEADVNNP